MNRGDIAAATSGHFWSPGSQQGSGRIIKISAGGRRAEEAQKNSARAGLENHGRDKINVILAPAYSF
jgi:hypothetical protein